MKNMIRDLIDNPNKPLTKEQKKNIEKYFKFSNNDIPAECVNIIDSVNKRVDEIIKKKTVWMF
jgi:hypothetical protein